MTVSAMELLSSVKLDDATHNRATALAVSNDAKASTKGAVPPPVAETDTAPRDMSGSTNAAQAGYGGIPTDTTPDQYRAKEPEHASQLAPATISADNTLTDAELLEQQRAEAASAGGLEDDLGSAPTPARDPSIAVVPTPGVPPPPVPAWLVPTEADRIAEEAAQQQREDDARAVAPAPVHVPAAAAPGASPIAADTDPTPSVQPLDGDYGDIEDDDYLLEKKSFLSGLPNPLKLFEKNPKLVRPVAIGAIGMVVAVGAAVIFGGSTASDTPAAPPPVVVEQPPGEDVGPQTITLLPQAVSASCPPGSTSPSMAFTSKPENAWVCLRAHGIDGAVMNVIFAKTVTVQAITVMPGWNYVAPNGRDHWNEHRLVSKILWRIGGQQFEQVINPSRSGSTLTLPGNGIATTVMSMTILETVTPSAVGVDTGPGEGGLMAPGGDLGAPNTDADKSTAIGSVTITGVEN